MYIILNILFQGYNPKDLFPKNLKSESNPTNIY